MYSKPSFSFTYGSFPLEDISQPKPLLAATPQTGWLFWARKLEHLLAAINQSVINHFAAARAKSANPGDSHQHTSTESDFHCAPSRAQFSSGRPVCLEKESRVPLRTGLLGRWRNLKAKAKNILTSNPVRGGSNYKRSSGTAQPSRRSHSPSAP